MVSSLVKASRAGCPAGAEYCSKDDREYGLDLSACSGTFRDTDVVGTDGAAVSRTVELG